MKFDDIIASGYIRENPKNEGRKKKQFVVKTEIILKIKIVLMLILEVKNG